MEAKQHDVTRDEHTRMAQSLLTVRLHLRSKHNKSLSEEETARAMESLDFLNRVLEFSASWNGVKTQEFFPEVPQVQEYLHTHDMERLGQFFAKQFADVSKELRQIGVEYPALLKKLYEAYYLRTLKRTTVSLKMLGT